MQGRRLGSQGCGPGPRWLPGARLSCVLAARPVPALGAAVPTALVKPFTVQDALLWMRSLAALLAKSLVIASVYMLLIKMLERARACVCVCVNRYAAN